MKVLPDGKVYLVYYDDRPVPGVSLKEVFVSLADAQQHLIDQGFIINDGDLGLDWKKGTNKYWKGAEILTMEVS